MSLGLRAPFKLVGFTPTGQCVIGGAFQAGDTYGLPLWACLEQARENDMVISIPHYFASAIEHGWDDRQTFAKLREGFIDSGDRPDFESMEKMLLWMFMAIHKRHPELVENEHETVATQVARLMREEIESDLLAKVVIATAPTKE